MNDGSVIAVLGQRGLDALGACPDLRVSERQARLQFSCIFQQRRQAFDGYALDANTADEVARRAVENQGNAAVGTAQAAHADVAIEPGEKQSPRYGANLGGIKRVACMHTKLAHQWIIGSKFHAFEGNGCNPAATKS